jgi:hypothetical protein
VYFIVGYYGHRAVERILAHPWAHDPKFQERSVKAAPLVYVIVLFVQFYGPQQSLGVDTERGHFSWKWDPVTVFLDQIVAIGVILLLSQAVRPFKHLIKDVGACSLGIFLGGDLIFFTPHGADKRGASFGIIVDKYEIMPTLQRTVEWTAGFWPAMVLAALAHTVFQIYVFGLPFHQLYLLFVTLCRYVSDYCYQRMNKK